jgi:hypothetical protein
MDIISIQNLEYMNCLRTDIENEIIEQEKKEDKLEHLRNTWEMELIEIAEHEDYECERCSLSLQSLRQKRLSYFSQKSEVLLESSCRVQKSEDTNPMEEVTKHECEPKPPNTKEDYKKIKRQCIGWTKAQKQCSIMCYDSYCHIHKKFKTHCSNSN